MKDTFLTKLIKEYKTFGFTYSLCHGFEQIDARMDLDYYLTITKNDIKGYDIVVTHKPTARQQIKIKADKKFIVNSLRNLYYLGF